MTTLRELAVVYGRCIICSKKTEINDNGLFLCSTECRIRFDELRQEIDERYY
jgi:predicted nucleic acid-binding Zn ribbon protein